MDQKKIGAFLKTLRKEKGVTQERLGELLGVSSRSVSRWETGSNLPDFDLLIELARYYDVEIGEILAGERTGQTMDQKTENTLYQIADYTAQEKERLLLRSHKTLGAGIFLYAMLKLMGHLGLLAGSPWNAVADFASGAACGCVLAVFLMTGPLGLRLRAAKRRLLRRDRES